MWRFWKKPAAVPVSEKVRLHLAKECGVPYQAAASLCMLEQPGRYSGRKVTYVRIFDPAVVTAMRVDLQHFGDLSTRRLLLYSGHVERNGQMVLRERFSSEKYTR